MSFCGHCGTQIQAHDKFCTSCGHELEEPTKVSIEKSFDSIVHRPASILAHGAALWAYYRRDGRARLTFSQGSGVASYRMDGKTFREVLPTSEIGHQYGLTAGALWAEALLALERDCQAATPRDWEQLISQFGLTTTRARDLRGTLLEMARDRAWTHLDEAITNLLADGS